MKHSLKLSGGLAATMLTACFLFSSCQKDVSNNDDETVAVETQMASEDDAEADVVYDEVFDNVMGVDEEVGLGTGIGVFDILSTNSRCFTVTRVPNTAGVFPKTITIDFGTGCTDRRGVTFGRP